MVSLHLITFHRRADRGARGPGVPDDVAQALLDDAVAVDRRVAGDGAVERRDVDVDRERRRRS